MKYTHQPRRKDLFVQLSAWATALIAATSMANPFNDGSTQILSTDTNYNETLYVGIQNPDNELMIIGGATVSATDVMIGQLTSSTNNSVSVSDDAVLIAGTADTNGLSTGGVVVGDADGGNAISINNASELNTDYLYVGFGTNDSGKVALSGNGTDLNVTGDAFVGFAGSTNSINIGSGSTLTMGGTLNVGSVSGTDNSVNVNAGGTLFVNTTNNINVINPEDDNGINIRGTATLQVGADADTGTMEELGVDISRNANLEVGGTLTINNNRIDDSLNVILNNDLSTNTASWSSGSLTAIGSTTSDNSLTITNGATGHALNILQIGQQTTAAGNELNVGGSNALFIADSDVFVGAQGKNNQLNISDGGQVDIASTLYLGGAINASENQVIIHSNGTLNVAGDIIVGDNSNLNTLNVEGGTVDVGSNFVLGNTANADGITYADVDTANRVTVGANSVMNIHQDLTVGMGGNGNTFSISDGGFVTIDGDAIIGKASDDNYIFLMPDNTNNLLNVAGDLVVGVEGGDNRFSIYGGTANIDGNLYLGAGINQYDRPNYIHLATTNAVLNVDNTINIGASNSANLVRVARGATINAKDLFVGSTDGVSNNTVTISGELYNGETGTWLNYVADSFVYVTDSLIIGNANGAENSVVVRNGGFLNVAQNNIYFGDADANILQILEGGTLQTIDWNTTSAATNVVLEKGSTLELGGSYLGTNRLDGSYELALNGSIATNNAVWDTGSEVLHVGFNAGDNTLTVKDGGLASTTANLIVGRSAKSTRNTLAATGTNSLIDIGNNLIVGNTASSENELTVEAGAQVDIGGNLTLGSRSAQNSATMTGLTNAVSILNIANNLTIGAGENATGNLFEISSNATVNLSGIATVGSSTDNNSLLLSGTNAVLNAQSNLVVGSGAAAENELTISEGLGVVGGNLIIGRDIDSTGNTATISGSNAILQVVTDLYVGRNGSENNLTLSDGGTVDAGNIYLGFTTNSQSNTAKIEGTNSTLTANGTLYAGYKGGNSLLEVTDGAALNISTAYIGYASGENRIEVVGTNSMFAVLNDLFIGNTETNAIGENALWVYEGAMTTVGGNLSLQSNSVLYIDAASQLIVDGNYAQDEPATLVVGISTNHALTNLVVGNTAAFAKNTTLQLVDEETVAGTTNDVQRALVAAGIIEIDEQTATQDLLNDYINIANDLLDFTLFLSNNIIWIDNVTRLSLADTSGLEPGSQLANIADEIDLLAGGSNDLAVAMRDFMDLELDAAGRNDAFHNYYGEKMSSTPAHNVINIGVQSVADELIKRTDSTRARMGAANAGMNIPEGTQGPHMSDQDLQGWITGFKTWGDRSADGGFDGYDGSINGLVLGADFSVAEGILLGVAGGSYSSNLDKDNGASTDTRSSYGSVYMSAGTKDWFADASIIYGSSSIDTKLGNVFDTKADYDAENVAIYFGGGKEIIGNYLIFTPQASLLGNYYSQDSYEETSTTALPRKVDGFDTLYVQSAVGCSIGFYSAMGEMSDTIIKPEFRAFWLHEFNDDEESLSYSLVGGTGSYTMLLQAPVSDIFKVGGGISTKLGEYLELRADLDARMAGSYSDYTLLGSLRYQF